jgi:hypothetical protein
MHTGTALVTADAQRLGAARWENSASGSSGPATRTPGCCWCCRWSTSSTWTAPTTPAASSGWRGLLLVGILSQPGGFFLHLWQGQPGERSVGTLVTAVGAVLIAAALITLAVGLIRAR